MEFSKEPASPRAAGIPSSQPSMDVGDEGHEGPSTSMGLMAPWGHALLTVITSGAGLARSVERAAGLAGRVAATLAVVGSSGRAAARVDPPRQEAPEVRRSGTVNPHATRLQVHVVDISMS